MDEVADVAGAVAAGEFRGEIFFVDFGEGVDEIGDFGGGVGADVVDFVGAAGVFHHE